MHISEAAMYMKINGISPLEDALRAYRDLLLAGIVIVGPADERVKAWDSIVEEYKELDNENAL